MRISFDLDDTLICHGINGHEPRPFWLTRLFTSGEPLRKGTRGLIQTLQQSGWEVWIYTTSPRSVRSIRIWLWSYGIHVANIVNQQIHDKLRKGSSCVPSKDPQAFGIDLHVDDSAGVLAEGQAFGSKSWSSIHMM